MGLDMYLTKDSYVKNWDFMDNKHKHQIAVKLGGKIRKDIKPERISYITEQVGYWRKANQIHNWFVKNCQNGIDGCRRTPVPIEKLRELLDLCKKVMESIELVEGKVTNGYTFKDGKKTPIIEDGKTIKNFKVAKKLLPTQGGFFFGGTEYDEWYVNDVQETIKILDAVVAEDTNGTAEYYYQSSW